MKIAWKKTKKQKSMLPNNPNLPFFQQEDDIQSQPAPLEQLPPASTSTSTCTLSKSDLELAESFQSEGNKLAEDGRYQEALGKWEASLSLIPERAALHEQKAQVLLEIGDAWNALKAATRAIELEPLWAEAWVTLGRAQLNFGEPDASIESFDRALALKSDSKDAQVEKQTAIHLIKKRKQLHLSGLSVNKNRFMVGDTPKSP